MYKDHEGLEIHNVLSFMDEFVLSPRGTYRRPEPIQFSSSYCSWGIESRVWLLVSTGKVQVLGAIERLVPENRQVVRLNHLGWLQLSIYCTGTPFSVLTAPNIISRFRNQL